MKRSLFFSGFFFFLLSTSALPQGALTPPGGPAPTMKSLDQIGAKLDQIGASQTAADTKLEKRAPISSLPFTITASGSYYLTDNLTGTAGQNGIVVNADDVAIDLNGFKLSGPGNNGIVAGTRTRTAIRNGTIAGWAESGISAGSGALVENVRAGNNAGRGISTGNSAVIHSCTVIGSGTNTSGRGIVAGFGSIISKCIVTGTNGAGAIAIAGGSGSLIVDCTARENNAAGGYAISGGASSTIVRCDASENNGTAAGIVQGFQGRVVECVSSGNTGANNHGIAAGEEVFISGCNSTRNGGDGINVESFCTVTNNTAASNQGDGIDALGNRNRIEGNNATGNTGFGVRVNNINAPRHNLIIRNSAAGNTAGEYVVFSDNAFGPVVSKANVTNGSNTNPHANFDFD